MSDVVRLVDRASVAVGDQAQLMEWLQNWLDGLKAGEYGEFRSIVVVLETKGGDMATISQSITQMDGTRLVGLLYRAAHKKLTEMQTSQTFVSQGLDAPASMP